MRGRLKSGWLLAVSLSVVVLAIAGIRWLRTDAVAQHTTEAPVPRRMAEPFNPTTQSAHYAVDSTADADQTAQVVQAVEALREAYIAFFPGPRTQRDDGRKLQLRLYRDQAEFKANNRSSPWAEAYYQTPTCHAYFAGGERNPYHWMLHEATHQLNREVAGMPRFRWSDEGVAAYFGASRLEGGKLLPGTIDSNAYPIWWLSSLALSGDLADDVAHHRIIPLRAVIDGTGPPIGQHVNLYYIEFWSLSHFLFHYNGGQYAQAYRRLLAKGGGAAEFEKTIGPIERVQAEWYGYLQELAATPPRPWPVPLRPAPHRAAPTHRSAAPAAP
ncbi:hypothetical protein [Lysobacter sp. GCM10012299]|uniref:hypothetical protein n=1 Tax=Lysobacter sp. GCM10012299 TaxID=3317333 RepID=UPI0036107121